MHFFLQSVQYFIPEKSHKNLVVSEEKFVSLILHRNAITLQHLIIQFPLCYPSSDHLRVVKSKRSEAVTKLSNEIEDKLS